MSRRRRTPRGPRGAPPPLNGGHQRVEERGDGDWVVRTITGATSTKTYTCPGCAQPIRPATPHVVVWPLEPGLLSTSGLEERRHWHSPCWRRRR
ncbi:MULTISPECIES: hypothetical protein [Mumia]|uniref:hypothetical protein n=1 Tax=Mumia TaxID=1546255 RepID=UPI00141F268C|nr:MULTISPECIES: hypothetical protein [unclassified Mumia]QMW67458.1 hypothetical protein H4N58_06030 [Mumia sp. ZJ1417]